jgi:hypothetical protein
MKKPIEVLMDQVEWHEIPSNAQIKTFEGGKEVPVATHEGTLNIGKFKFKVYQLSDGRRVIDEKDIKDFFGDLQDVLEIVKMFE